jgi:hypothetical protein
VVRTPPFLLGWDSGLGVGTPSPVVLRKFFERWGLGPDLGFAEGLVGLLRRGLGSKVGGGLRVGFVKFC